ncbi:MAG: hypothetical protein HY841_05380 [Bacteroidetes bacterium]|nr:hypothetical protein [Bacteroidota bacterium]
METRKRLREIYLVVTNRIIALLQRDSVLVFEKSWKRTALVKSRNRKQQRIIFQDKIPLTSKSKRRIPACDAVLKKMYLPPDVRKSSSKPEYCVVSDSIFLPSIRCFRDLDSYYESLFHELIHATGHPMRLNRKESYDFRSEKSVCIEEIIAEIGSCYLKYYTGIGEKYFKNSVAYIQDWLNGFYYDKRLILYACKKAQDAVNYVLVTGARQNETRHERKIIE